VIPYIEHPTVEIGGYTLTAFRVLVLAAVLVEYGIVVRRAPRVGLPRETAGSLILWGIGLGLVSSHVFDVITYYPERLHADPLALFRFWGSLSSAGGMLGGLAGIWFVARRHGLGRGELTTFLDVVLFALPFCLATGRLGCALQHDHLGIASDHPLAVAFPTGSRFDLGLLEFLAVALLGVVFLALNRRPWPRGFWIGAFFAAYGPIRFGLDFLRTDDARYVGLTPAQWLMTAASIGGIALLVWSLRTAPQDR